MRIPISEKTKLHVQQHFVHERETGRPETRHKRDTNKRQVKEENKDETLVLTDTLLNIERQGEFHEDDPCPYLGVRKPMRESRYPNDYYGITCNPHR